MNLLLENIGYINLKTLNNLRIKHMNFFLRMIFIIAIIFNFSLMYSQILHPTILEYKQSPNLDYRLRIKITDWNLNNKITYDDKKGTIHINAGQKLEFTYYDEKNNVRPFEITTLKINSTSTNFAYIAGVSNMYASYTFYNVGEYFVNFDVKWRKFGWRRNKNVDHLGIRVIVHSYSGLPIIPNQNICSGSSVYLYPNSTNNTNQYNYTWKNSSNQVITDFNQVIEADKKFILYIHDNKYNIDYVNNINIKKLSTPSTPTAQPQQNKVSCGVVELKNKKGNLLNHDAWYNYFGGILSDFTKTYQVNYFKTNDDCVSHSNSLGQNKMTVSEVGPKTFFYATKNTDNGCWSNCNSFNINLTEGKPQPPVVSDKTLCLCDKEDAVLTASSSGANLKTKWYLASDQTTPFKTASSITVPREENIFYVSVYDPSTLCESELSQVNLYTIPCWNCTGEFAPIIGKKYILSAWVKENAVKNGAIPNASISISYDGSTSVSGPFKASGPIIEGWQKIEQEFIIPSGATNLYLELNNGNISQKNLPDVYFDDIRIHPFDASMISYVYDINTKRLIAEMDANNFATYYSYDAEGNLIATRKETIEGIKTIQEKNTVITR